MDTATAYVVGGVINGMCLLSAGDTVLRAWRNRGRLRFADRWDALGRVANTLFFLLLSWTVTAWTVFPVAVWYLAVALSAAAAAGVVLRRPALPVRAEGKGAAGRKASAIGTLVLIAVIAAALLMFG